MPRPTERRGRAAPYHCTLDLAARLTDQARRAGVAISAGTDGARARGDALSRPCSTSSSCSSRRAGLTPAEAIRAATAIGAIAARAGSRTMGVIAPGRLANFWSCCARDPLADIANIRTVLFTVKRGRRFDRADFARSAPMRCPMTIA